MAKREKRFEHRALQILQSPDFFVELRAALRKARLVGEERNALTTYIVATSRLLNEPLNLLIKGRSSSGKNFLARTVLGLLPECEVMTFSSTSTKSWNYMEDSLRHKVIYLEERNKAMGPIHPARLLMSEKELVHSVAVRRGRSFVSERQVTKGPVACISTTTKNLLEMDDETRNLSIWMDDSAAQSRRIIKSEITKDVGLSGNELNTWRRVQKLLARRAGAPIVLPNWFEELADKVEIGGVRVRRYFPAFLSACRTVCLIRSFRKKSQVMCNHDVLRVRFSDFAITALIFNPILSKSLNGAEDEHVQTRQHLEVLSRAHHGKPVGASVLAQQLGVRKDKAYALLRRALQGGSIIRANPSERGNPKLYLPAPEKGFLPDPEKFFGSAPGLSGRVKFVHPLTGMPVTYERRSGSSRD